VNIDQEDKLWEIYCFTLEEDIILGMKEIEEMNLWKYMQGKGNDDEDNEGARVLIVHMEQDKEMGFDIEELTGRIFKGYINFNLQQTEKIKNLMKIHAKIFIESTTEREMNIEHAIELL
jgi:hypothetical protein